MNKSAVFSKVETADYYGYEFDYQADFIQFLEEAKTSAHQETLNTAQVETPGAEQLNNVKKKRKSWKNSLFSWLKSDKKGKKFDQQTTNGKNVSKPRRRHVSGPVQGTVGENTITQTRRPASGPLTGLFSSTKGADEYKLPYMCLGQIEDPHKLHSYGPVYLVT